MGARNWKIAGYIYMFSVCEHMLQFMHSLDVLRSEKVKTTINS